METYLALLALLLLMFLLIAAAVEAVIESCRGVLERAGFTWAKGKLSLEEVLALSAEFAPQTDLQAKFDALKRAADQVKVTSTETVRSIETLEKSLGDQSPDTLAAFNDASMKVKAQLEMSERTRILILRVGAGLVGGFLVWLSGLYVFEILSSAPDLPADLSALIQRLNEPWVNVLVGSVAASAGSSYWHDKLDKVRNLKSVSESFYRT